MCFHLLHETILYYISNTLLNTASNLSPLKRHAKELFFPAKQVYSLSFGRSRPKHGGSPIFQYNTQVRQVLNPNTEIISMFILI